MELDITQFFATAAPRDYSASVAEIGASAGADTWRAACDDFEEYPLLDTDEKREAFRAFVRASGGWEDTEIAAWCDAELNALCIQWVSGDMRNVPGIKMGPGMNENDWRDVEDMQHKGTIPGRIFRGNDGKIYFNISE